MTPSGEHMFNSEDEAEMEAERLDEAEWVKEQRQKLTQLGASGMDRFSPKRVYRDTPSGDQVHLFTGDESHRIPLLMQASAFFGWGTRPHYAYVQFAIVATALVMYALSLSLESVSWDDAAVCEYVKYLLTYANLTLGSVNSEFREMVLDVLRGIGTSAAVHLFYRRSQSEKFCIIHGWCSHSGPECNLLASESKGGTNPAAVLSRLLLSPAGIARSLHNRANEAPKRKSEPTVPSRLVAVGHGYERRERVNKQPRLMPKSDVGPPAASVVTAKAVVAGPSVHRSRVRQSEIHRRASVPTSVPAPLPPPPPPCAAVPASTQVQGMPFGCAVMPMPMQTPAEVPTKAEAVMADLLKDLVGDLKSKCDKEQVELHKYRNRCFTQAKQIQQLEAQVASLQDRLQELEQEVQQKTPKSPNYSASAAGN